MLTIPYYVGMGARVVAHRLAPGSDIPNHPRWPLLVYPRAVGIQGDDPARAFEALFTRNRWPGAWRDGIHPFPHFHSNAHEVLGIYSGQVVVQFGGEGGLSVSAGPGDVIVLPAGTGHQRLSGAGALGVVGAYPEGSQPDTCMPPFAGGARHAAAVAGVPLPDMDPVFGPLGPLFEHWR